MEIRFEDVIEFLSGRGDEETNRRVREGLADPESSLRRLVDRHCVMSRRALDAQYVRGLMDPDWVGLVEVHPGWLQHLSDLFRRAQLVAQAMVNSLGARPPESSRPEVQVSVLGTESSRRESENEEVKDARRITIRPEDCLWLHGDPLLIGRKEARVETEWRGDGPLLVGLGGWLRTGKEYELRVAWLTAEGILRATPAEVIGVLKPTVRLQPKDGHPPRPGDVIFLEHARTTSGQEWKVGIILKF
jgi:hypothetical protein